jgi:hypothetical protein
MPVQERQIDLRNEFQHGHGGGADDRRRRHTRQSSGQKSSSLHVRWGEGHCLNSVAGRGRSPWRNGAPDREPWSIPHFPKRKTFSQSVRIKHDSWMESQTKPARGSTWRLSLSDGVRTGWMIHNRANASAIANKSGVPGDDRLRLVRGERRDH